MNLYDVISIENAIEKIAVDQEGELTPEQWDALVNAQLSGIEQTKKLVSYVRHLEQFIEDAKEEKTRINDLQKRAENRIENIKKYVLPYIEQRGPIDAGTFKLSVRKSSRVDIDDNFNNPDYCEQIISYKPDKNKIKDAIKSGSNIPGARLLNYNTLQIK